MWGSSLLSLLSSGSSSLRSGWIKKVRKDEMSTWRAGEHLQGA